MEYTIKGIYATRRVFVNNVELTPQASWRVRPHSPDGFNWGYGGSGPAQLALALCLLVNKQADYYQKFKWDYISKLEQGKDFEIVITKEEFEKYTLKGGDA